MAKRISFRYSTKELDKQLRDELRQLGRDAIIRIKPFVPSQTIANSLKFRTTKPKNGGFQLTIFSPYYWAGIIHQGHGPVYSSIGKKLVWFRNPADDPRFQPWKNYPKKLSDIKRLTEDDFYNGMEANREMYNSNPSGGWWQYMVVVTEAPGKVGTPFFALGMDGFGDVMNKRLKPITTDAVRGAIEAEFAKTKLIFKISL